MAKPSKSHSKKVAYWQRFVNEWKRSGQSQAAFCQTRDLKLTTFRWWRHQLLREAAELAQAKGPESQAAFIPVRIVEASSSASAPIEILLPNARRIQVPSGFDPNTLRQVLAVLDESAC